ncbi:MAG: hypothetical protein M3O71_02495 [Bacteroidota bacterium]|nr:hypothetical protein [Bacteroidota bacterium]
MPHEWNSRIVVTKEELVPNWYSSHNLRTTIDRYKDRPIGIKALQRGGNGRIALYDFDTLPSHIQHGLGDPRDVKHVFEKYYRTDKEAVAFFRKFQFADGTYLSDEHQDRYIINSAVLKAIICFRADVEKERKRKGQNNTGITEVLRVHTIDFQKTLKVKHKDGHTLPESLKRFKEVLKGFESKGYGSLVSGKHGNDNSRKVYDTTLGLLESMFGKDTTKPTATDVHRAYEAFLSGTKEVINNTTGEVYNPEDFKKLSVTTVTGYLAQWQSQIATHGLRSGDRQKYMQVFKPHHSTDKPQFAGSLISIDDRQPPFKTHDGKRIWAYMAIDLGSEAFTTWVFGKTKEGIIKDFYQQLIRNYAEWGLNLPDGLECESSLNSSFVDTFLREGAMFQNVRIEPNNARGKKIERYFRELRYSFEKQREGWIARPFALSESNQTGSHDVPTLAYNQIIENCLADIQKWNNMPHSVHTHLTRWQVFEQMQNPNLKPTNYNSFLPHLGETTITHVKAGMMNFRNTKYLLGDNGEVCLGEKLISLMKRVEGQNVTIYWLNGNDDEVIKAIIYIDGTLICEAVPQPKYNRAVIERTPQCLINYEIMCKYVATIDAFAKSRKRQIEAVTIVDNKPPTKKTFVMRGLKQYNADEMPRGEMMPEPKDELEVLPPQSFARDLRDRY